MAPADAQPPVFTAFRGACVVVTLVAGLAGTVMLVAPDETDTYFSWPIGPSPLAALVGAFYLASAVTFAVLATRRDWPAARGVAFGILAFTLPTIVATVHHRDLFDWSRWQAVAWVALFVASPIAFSSFLFLQRGQAPATEARRLAVWPRALLAVLGAVYAVLAVGLLLAPHRLQDYSPFALPGLSGRFLGSWCAFLAVLALFAAWRAGVREATVPVIGLVLWPVAAVAAGARAFDDLQPASRRASYAVAVGVVGALAVIVLAVVTPSDRKEAGAPAAEP